MKPDFIRFLHHTLSYSGLTRISRWNKFADWFDLDHRVKPDGDTMRADAATCRGRSMVEMLGVLAIIGVLSVGAIAGYSKAMFKYRLNKMVDQYNQLFGTITIHREEFSKLSTPTQQVTLYPIIYKMGELPDGMKLYNNIFAYDIFKHTSEVRSSWGSTIIWYIQLSNHDEQHTLSTDLIEACRNIYQYLLIPRQDDIYQVNFYHNDQQGESLEGSVYGNKACKSGQKCLKNLTIGDIDHICNSAQPNRETRLLVWF